MKYINARVEDDLDIFVGECTIFQLGFEANVVASRLCLVDPHGGGRSFRFPHVGWSLERVAHWTSIDSWEVPKVYYKLWIGDAWRTHVTVTELYTMLVSGTAPAMETTMSSADRARTLIKTVRKQAGDGWKFLTPELREALVMAAAARLVQSQDLEKYAPAVALIDSVEKAMTESGVLEEKNV